MIPLSLNLSEAEKGYCEFWLRFHTTLYNNITAATFTTDTLPLLIAYEANTRQREPVLDRLMGRYAKLWKKKELIRISRYMEGLDGDFRERYRKTSEIRGTQTWRTSD